MEFVKPDTYIDFMRVRGPAIAFSLILVVASLVSLKIPGPNFGLDFAGGTELQLKFAGDVSTSELRALLTELGYQGSSVIEVADSKNEYMIRVLPTSEKERLATEKKWEKALKGKLGDAFASVKISPGLDKIKLRLNAEGDEAAIESALTSAGASVMEVRPFGRTSDHRYEISMSGVAQDIVAQLRNKLGAKAPGEPQRVEWVGPKAGEQLKEAAIKSLLWAIAIIMVYVAFRFDIRFAPGGVVAMLHDAIVVLGVYVLFQREMNLTTVAALLTIMGYSINDTIVVFDRIRENMGRLRDKSLRELINLSTSQMLSRTIVTSLTTLLSVVAFFIWGTKVIEDIAFALIVGIIVGTFSSIYIAAPITEWMDRRVFSRPA